MVDISHTIDTPASVARYESSIQTASASFADLWPRVLFSTPVVLMLVGAAALVGASFYLLLAREIGSLLGWW